MKYRLMKLRRDMFKIIPIGMMGLFLMWSGYYLVFGTNNIFALKTMKIQQAQLQANLDDVKGQRVAMESKVTRLRPGSLDWDMVEEQAIQSLGEMPKDAKSVKM